MDVDTASKAHRPHPFLSVMLLLILFIFCLFIGQAASWGILKVVYGYTSDVLKDLAVHPEDFPNSRMALLLHHAIGSIVFGFVLSSYLWKKLIEKESYSSFFAYDHQNLPLLASIACLATILSTPLNSVFISLNKKLALPPILEEIEIKMRAMEDSSERLVKFLTDFQNPQEIAMAVLVMGALTGLGEELFFRGAIQKKLTKWIKNPHIAIWIASAFFSFVHFQFYGFIPRMLLAALFGYMYYWSGNLWVPIIAHACNNSFTIAALYISKDYEDTSSLVESTEMMPIPAVVISLVLTSLLLYFFKKNSRKL
ncbi:MAG TPA: CPBP family intramembrane glutamic endopeptidase [Cytophagales bacterium]|nr:CPBP family intramembrane glutamic endopeptidase [Cytophagales bacterium]